MRRTVVPVGSRLTEGGQVTIPVVYDGEDLAEVGERTGLGETVG